MTFSSSTVLINLARSRRREGQTHSSGFGEGKPKQRLDVGGSLRKAGGSNHATIDKWLFFQREDFLYLLVQFINVPLGQSPRVYVARPPEMAAH